MTGIRSAGCAGPAADPPSPPAPPAPPAPHRGRVMLLAALAYLAAALALAAPNLGNPIIHVDDQFYHLVGGRMLEGALPFVDIWDRKPLGLFLLYEAFYALGGGSVLPHQLGAGASAAATALLIFRLARETATLPGAFYAGLAYLAWLLVFNCAGGQSPVFYNALMAGGGCCVLAVLRAPAARGTFAMGCAAMLLCGLALQIKYAAVFEAFAFGLLLLHADWRSHGLRLAWLRNGAAWALCALLPTIGALLYYAGHGHGEAFVQANFVSIFQRDMPAGASLLRLARQLALLTPFWLLFWLARRGTAAAGSETARRFIFIWAAAALAGFLAMGTYYAHYVAPLLVPFCILAAPRIARGWRPGAAGLLLLVAGFGIGIGTIPTHWRDRGTPEQFARLVALVEARQGSGCIYVHEADPALYDQVRSCLPTRFVFPDHLTAAIEAKALGADPVTELHRILGSRPNVIAINREPSANPPNLATRRVIEQALAEDYRVYAEASLGRRRYLLYAPR